MVRASARSDHKAIGVDGGTDCLSAPPRPRFALGCPVFLFTVLRKMSTTNHSRYMDSAHAVALSAPGVGRGRFRVGAVLIRRNRLITARHNSLKTHPALSRLTPWPNLHAESAAILAAGFDNSEDADLFVVRVLKDGTRAMARPCDVCDGLIRQAGIRRVWFSDNAGKTERIEI
jgi:tRNA(Arg) A34 adenosine deaminase TadA